MEVALRQLNSLQEDPARGTGEKNDPIELDSDSDAKSIITIPSTEEEDDEKE